MALPQLCDAAPEHAQQYYQLLRVSDGEFMPTVFGHHFERMVTQLFAEPNNIFSHQHVRLCVVGQQVAGMCYAFPATARPRQALRTALLMLRAMGPSMMARLPAMLLSNGLLGALDPRALFVSNMGVHPSYRGRGLGTVLLADAERRAVAANLNEMILDVRTQNTQAIGVYSRAGFQTQVVRSVWLNGQPFEYQRMRKSLGDAGTVKRAPLD